MQTPITWLRAQEARSRAGCEAGLAAFPEEEGHLPVLFCAGRTVQVCLALDCWFLMLHPRSEY